MTQMPKTKIASLVPLGAGGWGITGSSRGEPLASLGYDKGGNVYVENVECSWT